MSVPTLEFIMWEPLLLDNEGEGAPPNVEFRGCTGGPFILYVGISLCAFFAS